MHMHSIQARTTDDAGSVRIVEWIVEKPPLAKTVPAWPGCQQPAPPSQSIDQACREIIEERP